MKRRRLPRYGSASAGLTAERVELIRTVPKADAHYARLWRVRPQTILLARTGKTWRHVAVPPDTAPRAHRGNWGALTDTSSGDPYG